jgi:hypothetical protein
MTNDWRTYSRLTRLPANSIYVCYDVAKAKDMLSVAGRTDIVVRHIDAKRRDDKPGTVFFVDEFDNV